MTHKDGRKASERRGISQDKATVEGATERFVKALQFGAVDKARKRKSFR